MNYGLMLSCRVEELLTDYIRPEKWIDTDEAAMYEQILSQVLEERHHILHESDLQRHPLHSCKRRCCALC